MPLSPDAHAALQSLTGGLVVSCQARPDNPLHGPESMARMAEAAVRGGAVGIRANGRADIAAIGAAVTVPIIGIEKVADGNGVVTITPTPATAAGVVASGAQLVAFDGTLRPRPDGAAVAAIAEAIHRAGAAALADVATLEDGLFAVSAGADAVGTTLSGYTADSLHQEEPDFTLLESLVARCQVPVFAEGRIWTADQALQAIELGAAFVVVGTAITNPMAITERFVQALKTAPSRTHLDRGKSA